MAWAASDDPSGDGDGGGSTSGKVDALANWCFLRYAIPPPHPTRPASDPTQTRSPATATDRDGRSSGGRCLKFERCPVPRNFGAVGPTLV